MSSPRRAGLVVYRLAAYVPLQHVARDFYMKAAFLPERGVVKVSGWSIRNWDFSANGYQTVQQMLSKSLKLNVDAPAQRFTQSDLGK